MKTLDKTKYRGKGRPRKSDYVSVERGYEDYTTPQERKTPKAHELNDSPWIWLAVPAMLVAYLVIGWVMSLV